MYQGTIELAPADWIKSAGNCLIHQKAKNADRVAINREMLMDEETVSANDGLYVRYFVCVMKSAVSFRKISKYPIQTQKLLGKMKSHLPRVAKISAEIDYIRCYSIGCKEAVLQSCGAGLSGSTADGSVRLRLI